MPIQEALYRWGKDSLQTYVSLCLQAICINESEFITRSSKQSPTDFKCIQKKERPQKNRQIYTNPVNAFLDYSHMNYEWLFAIQKRKQAQICFNEVIRRYVDREHKQTSKQLPFSIWTKRTSFRIIYTSARYWSEVLSDRLQMMPVQSFKCLRIKINVIVAKKVSGQLSLLHYRTSRVCCESEFITFMFVRIGSYNISKLPINHLHRKTSTGSSLIRESQ